MSANEVYACGVAGVVLFLMAVAVIAAWAYALS